MRVAMAGVSPGLVAEKHLWCVKQLVVCFVVLPAAPPLCGWAQGSYGMHWSCRHWAVRWRPYGGEVPPAGATTVAHVRAGLCMSRHQRRLFVDARVAQHEATRYRHWRWRAASPHAPRYSRDTCMWLRKAALVAEHGANVCGKSVSCEMRRP